MMPILKMSIGAAALACCAAAPPAKPKPDLADIAAGSYFGEVTSDARGSSHSDVRVTVARIGPNRVRVTADYARLPAFTAPLTRAMSTIQNAGPGKRAIQAD